MGCTFIYDIGEILQFFRSNGVEDQDVALQLTSYLLSFVLQKDQKSLQYLKYVLGTIENLKEEPDDLLDYANSLFVDKLHLLITEKTSLINKDVVFSINNEDVVINIYPKKEDIYLKYKEDVDNGNWIPEKQRLILEQLK